MKEGLLRLRAIVLVILVALAAFSWQLPREGGQGDGLLHVDYLDVGQGDATLVTTPEGLEILIDGGRDSAVLRSLGTVLPYFDRTIDLVIATHPDSDHIGGLIEVLRRYDVAKILMTENDHDTPASTMYRSLVEQEGAEVVYARRGQVFSLGASTTLEVLWPETDPTEMESNTSSIVVKLSYADTSFIMTGDAPKNVEEYLVLAYGEHLKADVLKIGHHGSRTSSSELFVDEVDPTYAIISAGQDNSYGHPHVEVTDLLFNKGIETHSTAEEGTIQVISDGTKITIE